VFAAVIYIVLAIIFDAVGVKIELGEHTINEKGV
jgi:hypothetical protein